MTGLTCRVSDAEEDAGLGGLSQLSRRNFVAAMGGIAAAGFVGCRTGTPLSEDPDALIYSSATDLAEAIRRKRVSSLEAVNAYLSRIEAVNPRLNAVVHLAAEEARAAARRADANLTAGQVGRPLHGVPITIKDSLDTAGMISTGGTAGRASFAPAEDATVVKRLREAGAIVMGKTNTPELTLSFETDNAVYGRTNNPYDLTRTSGGSSGGAAALIAAGGTPLDLGSDTGGSIRLPSHFCGIAGIKPTSGRVPRTGHIISAEGLHQALTQIGPMARFVDDLILTLPIIAGPDWHDSYVVPMPLGDPSAVDLSTLRVAFHTDNGISTPTPEVQAVVRDAARALSGLGAVVEEDRPPSLSAMEEITNRMWYADGGAWVRRILEAAGTTTLSAILAGSFRGASALSAAELTRLIEQRDRIRGEMFSFLETYDVIVCPVNAQPAMPHGATDDIETLGDFSYTYLYNEVGWPGAVVRGGTSPEGLPIGVQVLTGPWREDVALAVVKYLEEQLGGWKPPEL